MALYGAKISIEFGCGDGDLLYRVARVIVPRRVTTAASRSDSRALSERMWMLSVVVTLCELGPTTARSSD